MSADILYKTPKSRSRLQGIATRFEHKRALNIGSGATNFGPHFVNVDIGPFPHVEVIAQSESLPFPDGCFDLVVSQAVLEHVADPGAAAKEMLRVLKPGGELYAEIPFIQGYHPTPEDFQRYTLSGIERLFSGLTRIEKGVVNGPASALCWILREFLAMTFSCGSQTLYKIGLVLFAWVVLPIKYLDIFLEGSRFAPHIASGLFFLGKKPEAGAQQTITTSSRG
jgi:SAM-dependent methyltransferase